MKLKAKEMHVAELPVDALSNLEKVIAEKNPQLRVNLWKTIEEEMEGNDLSIWCVLFVQFILHYASVVTDKKFITFFGIVLELDISHAAELSGLRLVLGGVAKELKKLQDQQYHLLHSSYTSGLNGANLLDQDAKITDGISKLDIQMQSVQGLCLILEKIVVILNQHKLLQKEQELLVKKTIAGDPVKFIVSIIPIISLLQKGNADDLQKIIQLTLTLFGLKHSDVMTTAIEQALYQQYLEEDVSAEPEKSSASSQTVQQPVTLFYKKTRPVNARRINQLTQQMNDLCIPETIFEGIEEEEACIEPEDLTETVSL